MSDQRPTTLTILTILTLLTTLTILTTSTTHHGKIHQHGAASVFII